MTRRNLALGVGALVAIGVLAFWPKKPPGPEELIERRVVLMTDAAERKDVSGVLEGVSESFRGAQGWTRDNLKGMLVAQLLRGQWVRVFLTGLEIDLETDTRARVRGTFLFGRSDAKTAAELSRDSVVDAWTVEGVIEREADGEWRFVSETHERPNLNQLIP